MLNSDLSIGILCGGRSKRFGTDKIFHKINGKTILEIVYEKFHGYSNDIFLQTSNNDSERLNKFKINARFHHDTVEEKGALGGIYSALNHAKNQKVFILAGDLPFVDNNILTELKKSNSAQVVVPKWKDGFVEPLCAIYSKSIIPIIRERIEKDDLKINNLYTVLESQHDDLRIEYIDIDELIQNNKIDARCFKNINCLEDLKS